MTFIWQFIGALFAVAGATLALTISLIALYIVIIGLQSIIEERIKKAKRKKKERLKLANNIIEADYIQGVVETWYRTKDLSLASDICLELYNLMQSFPEGAKDRKIILEVNDEAKI